MARGHTHSDWAGCLCLQCHLGTEGWLHIQPGPGQARAAGSCAVRTSPPSLAWEVCSGCEGCGSSMHYLNRGLRIRAPTDAEQGPMLHSICSCLLILSRLINRFQPDVRNCRPNGLQWASFSLTPPNRAWGEADDPFTTVSPHFCTKSL